jgi:hypothetical protein
MKMPRMTEQEALELDELLTRIDPKIGINGTGFLSIREARSLGLDELSINYLMTKANAEKKSFAQVIGEMVREKIAASA